MTDGGHHFQALAFLLIGALAMQHRAIEGGSRLLPLIRLVDRRSGTAPSIERMAPVVQTVREDRMFISARLAKDRKAYLEDF